MASPAVSQWRRNLPSTGLRSSPAHTMWPWPGWTAGVGSDVDRRPLRWIHANLAHLKSKIIWMLWSQYTYNQQHEAIWQIYVRVYEANRLSWCSYRLLMQLPYIDDRRMALYGKVTVLSKFGISLAPNNSFYKAVACFVCCSTFLFLPTGIWWLLDSQDVSCNR